MQARRCGPPRLNWRRCTSINNSSESATRWARTKADHPSLPDCLHAGGGFAIARAIKTTLSTNVPPLSILVYTLVLKSRRCKCNTRLYRHARVQGCWLPNTASRKRASSAAGKTHTLPLSEQCPSVTRDENLEGNEGTDGWLQASGRTSSAVHIY